MNHIKVTLFIFFVAYAAGTIADATFIPFHWKEETRIIIASFGASALVIANLGVIMEGGKKP